MAAVLLFASAVQANSTSPLADAAEKHDRAAIEALVKERADVNAALGIAVLGDRVIVSAYENVFVFRDTDGDDRADEKTVLFKRQKADHDHTTHSFVFGPDGRIYFNAGDAGGPLMDPTGKVLTDKAGSGDSLELYFGSTSGAVYGSGDAGGRRSPRW